MLALAVLRYASQAGTGMRHYFIHNKTLVYRFPSTTQCIALIFCVVFIFLFSASQTS